MVRDFKPRRLPGNLGNGVDEILGVELVPAGVTLVPAGAFAAAYGARALNIAVGKGVSGHRVDGHILLLDDHVPVVAADLEHALNHAFVVDRGGPGEEVVRQAEGHKVLDDDPVVLIGELLGGLSLGLGRDEDRSAVLVRSGDHEHILAAHSHVPGKDVRGDSEARDVADVAGAVGVRPCNCREDMRHRHKITSPRGSVHLSPHTWTRLRAGDAAGARSRASAARPDASVPFRSFGAQPVQTGRPSRR